MTTSTGARASRPAVTVSMPAYDVEPYIGAAIESVLAQDEVDLELVVVDDASTDATADIARSYTRDGVHLLSNPERSGIGFGHNRVLLACTTPFVAHVDADDLIVPGALAEMVAALGSDEGVGQSYCDFFPVGVDGGTDAEELARWERFFAEHRRPPIDVPRELVEHGMVVSALRTYRRSVFDEVGLFDETLPWAVDFEMTLRVAERYTFAHVPKMLYGRRLRSEGVSQTERWKGLRHWKMRNDLVLRRLRAGGGRLYGRSALATRVLLLRGLLGTVKHTVRAGASSP